METNSYQLYYNHDLPVEGAEETESGEAVKDYFINLLYLKSEIVYYSDFLPNLRLTDGVLIVVDFVTGISSQSENLLRYVIREKIKPIVFINNIDVGIFDS